MARSLQVDANRNDDDLGGIIVEKTSASLIDGYEILSEIGRGGVGVVYKAKDAVGAFVALKLLQDRRGYLTHRFKCEFQHLIDLDHHPRIARAYQFGIHHDSFYFTSEYIDGSDLCSYLRGRSLLEMIGLFLQVLDALDFIHRHGLVHLDIKSENILVNKKGEAKLLDFGIAMRPEDVDALIGSIPYLAPEVVFGWKEKLDARADLFSFGVLMYRCLTGFFPFARTAKKEKGALQKSMAHEVWRGPPSSINQTVPVWLDTIVERLLNTDPAERWYTSARAVMNALKTHEPEQFREERDDRNAYLIPKGKKHIGREEEQTKLFGLLDGLLQNSAKQPPMVMIEG
ncbi:MAG: serine/threonine protein kinase, partial [Deltaproteobacteria bacterium]|nr:serine/threonine protein kinase [Deltaproteobacteria bacterium]